MASAGSASRDQEGKAELRGMERVSLLLKPFSIAELYAAIEESLAVD